MPYQSTYSIDGGFTNMKTSDFWKTNKGRRLKGEASAKRVIENANKYADLTARLNKLHEDGALYGFTRDMYIVLTKGTRPFTEKMYKATVKAIERPEFDEVEMIKQKEKAKGLIEKVNIAYDLVMEIDGNKKQYYVENYSPIPFIESIKKQVEKKYWLSKKQMEGLNKVYKKYLKKKEKLDG